jgi:hypothetical protein
LLTLVHFNPVFNQLYQCAIGTQATALGDISHLRRNASRKGDALAHRLCNSLHGFSMHQNGAYA